MTGGSGGIEPGYEEVGNGGGLEPLDKVVNGGGKDPNFSTNELTPHEQLNEASNGSPIDYLILVLLVAVVVSYFWKPNKK